MGKPAFTKEEMDSLRQAAALLDKYKFSDVFGDISGALQKVIDVIGISSSQQPGDNHDFIHPEKVPHFKGSEYLVRIIRAVQKEEVLRIYYHPFYEDKPYFAEVHPYLLKEYRNRWYMIGLHDFKDQLRTYALDRIRDIQVSELTYKKQTFNAREYFMHAIGIIAPEGDPPRIRIAVQKTQAQYLITQPWHESQNIEDETGDEVLFSFRVHPTYEFISLLLSYGKDLRVIAPASLRERIGEELKTMSAYYPNDLPAQQ